MGYVIFIYSDGKEWPVMACPLWAVVVLYRMLATFTLHEIYNICDTVPAFNHLNEHLAICTKIYIALEYAEIWNIK